ncbi:helix-turn-helix transcriptional regulator [Lactobacillus sp. SL9-6]|nr:helix-turn-helix transcriptional regulator [Lactobacillus sp. SL9-6]
MTIYQRIKELATEKNISIREVESTLNLANGTLNKWKERANTEKLQKVADYFGVTVDYLLGNDKSSNSSSKSVDLNDDDAFLTFEGKPIPEEDLELIKRLLRGK